MGNGGILCIFMDFWITVNLSRLEVTGYFWDMASCVAVDHAK